jgi:hypothetical protein
MSRGKAGSSVYANKLNSAVKLTNDGYIVEAAIELPDSMRGRVIANTSNIGALKLVRKSGNRSINKIRRTRTSM